MRKKEEGKEERWEVAGVGRKEKFRGNMELKVGRRKGGVGQGVFTGNCC